MTLVGCGGDDDDSTGGGNNAKAITFKSADTSGNTYTLIITPA